MTLADFEDAMATHFGGRCTRSSRAPAHARGGDGRIVNISSSGGKIPFASAAVLREQVRALTGLSEGLRAELAREGSRHDRLPG